MKGVKVPDVSGSNFDTAFEDEGDVQECGNYKDINFMSHTAKVRKERRRLIQQLALIIFSPYRAGASVAKGIDDTHCSFQPWW